MNLKFGILRNWLLTLLMFFCYQSYGQDVISKIDRHDLRSFIDRLSSVQFEGRSVDNYGQIKTRDFIVDRYKTLQLAPYFPDGYLEKFYLLQKDPREAFLITNKGIILDNLKQIVFAFCQ